MCTGVCTTMSKSFFLPVFASTEVGSPLSTRMMHLSTCDTTILLFLFLFEKCKSRHELGSLRSCWNDHGPGPIKLDAISDMSSSGPIKVCNGDCRNASGSSDSRGRIGWCTPFLSSCLMESNTTFVAGSVRATLLPLARYSVFSTHAQPLQRKNDWEKDSPSMTTDNRCIFILASGINVSDIGMVPPM